MVCENLFFYSIMKKVKSYRHPHPSNVPFVVIENANVTGI